MQSPLSGEKHLHNQLDSLDRFRSSGFWAAEARGAWSSAWRDSTVVLLTFTSDRFSTPIRIVRGDKTVTLPPRAMTGISTDDADNLFARDPSKTVLTIKGVYSAEYLQGAGASKGKLDHSTTLDKPGATELQKRVRPLIPALGDPDSQLVIGVGKGENFLDFTFFGPIPQADKGKVRKALRRLIHLRALRGKKGRIEQLTKLAACSALADPKQSVAQKEEAGVLLQARMKRTVKAGQSADLIVEVKNKRVRGLVRLAPSVGHESAGS